MKQLKEKKKERERELQNNKKIYKSSFLYVIDKNYEINRILYRKIELKKKKN